MYFFIDYRTETFKSSMCIEIDGRTKWLYLSNTLFPDPRPDFIAADDFLKVASRFEIKNHQG